MVSASWDLQFQRCLAEASRAKTTAVRVEGMRSGTVVSRAGKLFYDTLKVKKCSLEVIFTSTQCG